MYMNVFLVFDPLFQSYQAGCDPSALKGYDGSILSASMPATPKRGRAARASGEAKGERVLGGRFERVELCHFLP